MLFSLAVIKGFVLLVVVRHDVSGVWLVSTCMLLHMHFNIHPYPLWKILMEDMFPPAHAGILI